MKFSRARRVGPTTTYTNTLHITITHTFTYLITSSNSCSCQLYYPFGWRLYLDMSKEVVSSPGVGKSILGKSRQNNQDASDLEKRIKGGLEDARANFNSLHQVSSNNEIVSVDKALSLFLRLKSDTRMLLTYYREVVGAHIFSLEGGTRGGVTGLGSVGLNLFQKFPGDLNLVEFENNFEKLDDAIVAEMSSSSSSTQAASSQYTKRIEKILELCNTKDLAMFKIVNIIIEQLGVDHVVQESNMAPTIMLCSKEIPILLTFFRTFRALSIQIKRLSLSRGGEMEAVAEISSKQMQIAQQNKDLENRAAEILVLRNRLASASMETGRQHTIIRQQEVIESLELKVFELQRALERSVQDHRQSIQQSSYKNDQLINCRSQLASAKAAYERDVSKLQPLVEEQISKTQVWCYF